MIHDVVILGSTGSIGTSALSSIAKNKKFKIYLLTTKKNAKKVLKQAKKFNVKKVIITDLNEYNKYKYLFKKNKINFYFGLNNLNKVIKKKISYTINGISGIDGLEPTLKIIPLTRNILIANKESIVCGWHLIKKKLNSHKTKFIPIDSEHFSIWSLIKNEKPDAINKIILTASGGPFLNIPVKKLKNVDPRLALKHPNWKMGKKISIDSSTMMNKVLEFIEAKKIFNVKKKQISIIIHPSSYIHAIVYFKSDIIKLLAHETKMSIPISNALGITKTKFKNDYFLDLKNFNNLNFSVPSNKQFPLLSLIDLLPDETSYFETILISINDILVSKFLDGSINYLSLKKNLMNLIKSPYFKKYYKLKPKNIYDIKNMIDITKKYLELNLKYYNEK